MRSPVHRWLLLASSLTLRTGLTAPAEAQAVPWDTRVRVTASDARTIGRVERTTADSLHLSLSSGGRLALSWADVARVERSAGRRSNPGRGALIGTGAMTVLVVGSVLASGTSELEDRLLLLTLPPGAALGAGVDALVGLMWVTERREALPIEVGSAGGIGPPSSPSPSAYDAGCSGRPRPPEVGATRSNPSQSRSPPQFLSKARSRIGSRTLCRGRA
jgi:hypothetical protein